MQILRISYKNTYLTPYYDLLELDFDLDNRYWIFHLSTMRSPLIFPYLLWRNVY